MILDEAQAIKNASSQTAKAARLLRGRHRLALTGTPIENHLGELWSLFEFLNPGMLGASALLSTTSEMRTPDAATRELLARALRPFILRRTKEQVAPELPAKIEQTLFCELPPEQRRLYDELRDHYQSALGAKIGTQGLGRTKILVLEALLRLRQAACHPGLLDPERADEPCAKLDMLLPQLARDRRRGPQGAGLLAVHQLPGASAPAARRRRASPTTISTAARATARRRSSSSSPTPPARSS